MFIMKNSILYSVIVILISIHAGAAEADDLIIPLQDAKKSVQSLPSLGDQRYQPAEEKKLSKAYDTLREAQEIFVTKAPEDELLAENMVLLANEMIKKDPSADALDYIFKAYKKSPPLIQKAIKKIPASDLPAFRKSWEGRIEYDKTRRN
jgi:hypothetical protein